MHEVDPGRSIQLFAGRKLVHSTIVAFNNRCCCCAQQPFEVCHPFEGTKHNSKSRSPLHHRVHKRTSRERTGLTGHSYKDSGRVGIRRIWSKTTPTYETAPIERPRADPFHTYCGRLPRDASNRGRRVTESTKGHAQKTWDTLALTGCPGRKGAGASPRTRCWRAGTPSRTRSRAAAGRRAEPPRRGCR